MNCLAPSTDRRRRPSDGCAKAVRESDRRTNQQVIGAILLAIGGNWLLAELGFFSLGWPGLFAIALMTLGMSMVGTAKAGRTAPLVVLGIFLTMGLVMSSGVSNPLKNKAVGDEVHTPESPSELLSLYEHDLGDITLDLSDLKLDQRHDIDVKLGVGDIKVVVPADVAVKVNAKVGPFGDIELFDTAAEDRFGGEEGEHQDSTWSEAAARLNLDLDVGAFGDITVERAS